MPPAQLGRRSLAAGELHRISHRFTDVVVLGTGVAGLSAALEAAAHPQTRVLVIAKEGLEETATLYAQGGIAAVLEPGLTGDSIESHIEDTLRVSGGLCDPAAVRATVVEGVERVRQLIELGAEWDRGSDGTLHYTLEAGHSKRRILHRGDTTGRELQRVLTSAAHAHPRVNILEHTFAIDLITPSVTSERDRRDDAVTGVLVCRHHGGLEAVWAKQTILATGGLGRLFRETTNPTVATGDGVAMAFRAGAVIQDLEFVQFHPTTLYLAGADRFLITEAVRGEGGVLVDRQGHRFMNRFHPRADLAPRDVVSRAIITVLRESGDNKVFLDLSPIPPERIRERFPQIREKLRGFGIDILKEPIPVRPSAHYSVGGVQTDLQGRTSVPGLFAVGEVASTGLHGANRLASNSLLEGLVFGHRAGARAAEESVQHRRPEPTSVRVSPESSTAPPGVDLEDLAVSLRSLLWRNVGVERNVAGLERALEQIGHWIPYGLGSNFHDVSSWTTQNMLQVAYLLSLSALRRQESRGVHFRVDFPEPDELNWNRHLTLHRSDFLDARSGKTSEA